MLTAHRQRLYHWSTEPSSEALSTRIIANSHPAIPAVLAAIMQNIRLAQAERLRSHTNPWIAASISEAEVAPVQITVTQFIGFSPSGKSCRGFQKQRAMGKS
jgi:hypothetical protein